MLIMFQVLIQCNVNALACTFGLTRCKYCILILGVRVTFYGLYAFSLGILSLYLRCSAHCVIEFNELLSNQ